MEPARTRAAPVDGREAAELLRAASAAGRRVRLVGGGTKLDWGAPAPAPDLELATSGLGRIVAHDAGDLTAVLEAGVPLARAQAEFAAAGQMLALDPPLGAAGAATIGGIVATGDGGPLRHRHGAVRDLVLGIRVALSDGTLARAGGRVIKNVAGYDLAKLFAGSFGSLGLIVEVAVRLHPRPAVAATAVGAARDPDALGRAAQALAAAPLELECLDVHWAQGHGEVLARFTGATAPERARGVLGLLERAGTAGVVVEGDAELWERQRAAQRAPAGAVLRVSGRSTALARVLRAADGAGAAVVGRAGLGLSWLRLPGAAADDLVATIGALRRELAPFPAIVLDAPAAVRAAVDPWDARAGGELELMRALKRRFDPALACNAGLFVGGI